MKSKYWLVFVVQHHHPINNKPIHLYPNLTLLSCLYTIIII
ncbi:hypothetical protein [Moraxella lacunata]